MDSERYRRVMQVVDAVIDCPTDKRELALMEACGNDVALRLEAERLLAHQSAADSFLEKSPLEAIADLHEDTQADSLIGEPIGTYRITEEIGRGGMGAVYKAVRDDEEYKTEVAIKLIKRGMDTDDILQRFRNERQILANLNHPNIARLLDGGTTADGLPYFVMEYIEGKPVNEYCDSQKLSTIERLELFRTICSAIQYAHQNLVIHRDLKPSNILITRDGTPKLLDFGIAKILRSDSAADTTEVTETVFRVMTPEYASPEQIKGERITASSDVYSLGVLLYELLTGCRPYRFKSRRPEEVAKVIFEEEPEKPSTAISRIENTAQLNDSETGQITQEYLSKLRSSSPEKLRRQLRGDLDNIVLMALRKEPQRRYVSVEQFSKDIRRYLEGLPVIARKDTFTYRSSKLFQRNFVQNWKTAFISLLLSILLAGLGIGLSIYWVRSKAGNALVAENKTRVSRHETVVPQAHEAYLKGRFLWNKRTDEDLRKAIEQFNQAIALEPNYAEAYAGIADSYVILAMVKPKDPRREMIEKARAAALRAIEIDETVAEPHASLGFIHYDYDWNWEASEKEYRRAIELNPIYPTAHHWYAYLLQNIGRNDEAVAEIKRARELDPLSSPISRDVAEILTNARRYDEAIEYLRKRIELDENDIRSRDLLTAVLWYKGQYQESIDEDLKVIDLTKREPGRISNLAASYLMLGRKAEAQKLIREAKRRGLKEFTLQFYAPLCDKDKIFEWLEDRYNSRDGIITNLKVNPAFDCIRSDPRYEDLARRLGLP